MRRIRRLRAILVVAAAAVFFIAASPGAAQDGVVTGTVTNQAGEPQAAVQVRVVGTELGAFTNEEGQYRIVGVSPGEVTIRASRIGMAASTQTVTVAAGETVTVNLVIRQAAIDLDAIVVTGTAGLQERRVQGAQVARINAAELTEVAPITSISELLQARTAGVSLTQSSGTSGTAQRIRIRGGGSINLSNEPLIFIDGVRMDNRNTALHFTGGQVMSRLNDLDPNEIESIEVVKGPAAATLYGADASAGVIQIITKRGEAGTPFTQTVNVGYEVLQNTWTTPANFGNCPEVLTGPADPRTGEPHPLCSGQEVGAIISDAPLERAGVWRDGNVLTTRWSGRGGGENFGYFVSVSGHDEEGVLPNNAIERFSARTNFDWTPHETLSVDVSWGLTRNRTQLPDNDNNIYGWLGGALLGTPINRGAAADGWFSANRQVDAISSIDFIATTIRTQPSITVNHSPLEWLNHRLTVGVDMNRTQSRKFFPRNDNGWYATDAVNSGSMEQRRQNRDEITFDYQANATRPLTDDLDLTLSTGTLLISRTTDLAGANGIGFVTNAATSIGAAAETSGVGSFSEFREAGFFGQAQFGWRDVLYVTGATRWDFNSAFGDTSESFVSPKAEVSYVISDEAYMDGIMSDNFSSLRLRAAWGRSARSPGATAALTTFGASPFAISTAQTGSGVVPVNPGNPDLRPEKGEEFELGFDAGFLNERVGLDVTWFSKESSDLILNRPLAPSLGFSQDPVVNVGALENSGLEVGIDARIIQRQAVDFDLRVSMSTLTQEITDLGDVEPFGTATRVDVGLQPFARFTHRVREVDLENQVAIVSDTMEFVGNNTPDFEGSVAGTLTLFQNLRLYGQMDWQSGFVIYNNTDQFRERQFGTGERWVRRDDPDVISPEERIRRFGPWITETDGDAVATANADEEYIENGDFARLREVSLTYTLPSAWASRFGANRASITVGGRNLALWTDYNGPDPEALQANTNFTRSEFLTVPQARRWITRVNLTF